MLKNLDPLLNADLLKVLRAMGHGDEIAIVDANFPAHSVAEETVTGELIRLDGVGVAEAMRAILTVLPLDTFVEQPVLRMEVVGKPEEVPPVQAKVQAVIDAAEGRSWPMGSIERFEFYDRAKEAYAVVATGERQFYGCFLVKKGVIAPP
jgi:L-fucose mutarotase